MIPNAAAAVVAATVSNLLRQVALSLVIRIVAAIALVSCLAGKNIDVVDCVL